MSPQLEKKHPFDSLPPIVPSAEECKPEAAAKKKHRPRSGNKQSSNVKRRSFEHDLIFGSQSERARRSALIARPTEQGLHNATMGERADFMALCWLPYMNTLRKVSKVVKNRIREGSLVRGGIPLRGREIGSLVNECHALTEVWYGAGKGNYSAWYRWFVATMELAEVSAYPWSAIPTAQ